MFLPGVTRPEPNPDKPNPGHTNHDETGIPTQGRCYQMTTESQGLTVAGVHGGVVQFSVGTDPQHHFASHGQVSRKLAEVADTTSGTVWVGSVTGAWLDESDLQTLEAAIQNARTNQDDVPHVYVPDPTEERRCIHCAHLPGHCTGGAA